MGKIGLIIGREFKIRVRKKMFIVTTILMPLAMVAMMTIPMLITSKGEQMAEARNVVVIDSSGVVGNKLQGDKTVIFINDTTHTFHQAITAYDQNHDILLIGADVVANPSELKLYTHRSSTVAMENTIRQAVSSVITTERIAMTQIEGLAELISSVQVRASMQTFQFEDMTIIVAGEQVQPPQSKSTSSGTSMLLGYISGFLIYFFVLIYGAQVLHGVVEEKANRIVEVLVSSVKPFELMMGKILGIAFVALLQFTIWVVLIGVAMLFIAPSPDAMGDTAQIGRLASDMMGMLDLSLMAKMIAGFIVFFIGGYLLYASMFAAIGSAVDNVGDTQQLQIPVTLPLMISIMVLMFVMVHPHTSIAFWFSIIPFTSPIIMMARIPYGVPLWEVVLSVVVLYGSFIAMTTLAAKIYRTGIFMYGKKPTLKEIIKWARYKN